MSASPEKLAQLLAQAVLEPEDKQMILNNLKYAGPKIINELYESLLELVRFQEQAKKIAETMKLKKEVHMNHIKFEK